MDTYVMVGTVLAVMAGYVLFTQRSRSTELKKQSDVSKIGEQMRLYKAAAAAAAAKKPVIVENNNIADFPGGCVTIVFGSQTGTAEGFADVLKKEGRKHGFATRSIDLEEYNAAEALPKEKRIIFIMATYGEGDPTDNAVEFTKFIKGKTSTLGADAFTGVGYTVFGLGNRQYEHFNYMGRLVDDKMEKYGAKRVYHYGEGDDDGSMDEDFDNWKEKLWKELRNQFIPGAAEEEEEDVHSEQSVPELEYTIEEVRAPVDGITPPVSASVHMKPSTKHFFTASNVKVVVNRQIRQSTVGGSTVHVEMDLRDTGVSYLTADNLAVLPENQASVVSRLARVLGYDLEHWVTLKPVGKDSNGELPFPSPASIEKILTSYLSINSAPRKGPLKQLAYYAKNEKEREKLIYLTSKEGKDEYQKWILDDERSYVDVLETFRSVKVPLAALIQLVPFMTPRYYTISSSSLVNAQRVHITVSVIANKKSDGREFNGVCSTHLGELVPLDSHDTSKKKRQSRPGEQGLKKAREWPTARIFIRTSTFRLPKNPLTPIIMIGPGTGIAPMRAFLHERDAMIKKGENVGKSILFFGCRRRDEDYIYRDELEEFQKSGVLTELHLAFSRETSEKLYVQHLLKQQSAIIWNMIKNENAYIYVCGATSMGNDVHNVLHDIIETHANESSNEAAAALKQLQKTNRYIQELWA